jgi:hypothetical protein
MNSTLKSAASTLLTLAAVLAVGLGCGSVQVRRDPGVVQRTPTDPASIRILWSTPTNAFVRLGEITLEPKKKETPAEAEQALRKAAASLGANAVVIIADRPMLLSQAAPDSWIGRDDPHLVEPVIVGLAIEYTP